MKSTTNTNTPTGGDADPSKDEFFRMLVSEVADSVDLTAIARDDIQDALRTLQVAMKTIESGYVSPARYGVNVYAIDANGQSVSPFANQAVAWNCHGALIRASREIESQSEGGRNGRYDVALSLFNRANGRAVADSVMSAVAQMKEAIGLARTLSTSDPA